MRNTLVICYLVSCVYFTFGETHRDSEATRMPLNLSEYIENGRPQDGQKAARVLNLFENVESYSGFFTVNSEHQSNLFCWYFPAEDKSADAPVVLWLQGGPGLTSLSGLFSMNGPVEIHGNLTLGRRKHSWTTNMHMIYIDNPVGTGFSYTRDAEGYASDESQVGLELLNALIQLFQIFPELQRKRFFIAGESYAGKFIPILGYFIHNFNPTSKIKINLQGMAIGNGLIDPENMLNYGTYLYQLGLVDSHGFQLLNSVETDLIKCIRKKNYEEAGHKYGQLFMYIGKLIGRVNMYNYLQDGTKSMDHDITQFVSQDYVRKMIHVGNLPFNNSTLVLEHLIPDLMKSMRPTLQQLMEEYRILLYNGQLDILVPYVLTSNMVDKLKWSGSLDFAAAKREKLSVDGQLAGYFKTVKNFTQLLVRDAGHKVCVDQPLWAHRMITNFTQNQPLRFDSL